MKERIVEQLAVSKLKQDLAGPILCFVGPPGVGKTSLGHSIARALGRRFQRISVGGVRDEAEIRGHRRTYIGAMPGTIVRALRDAGSCNPVLLIDEIDKMGADFRGDPASAMLEVLDPEQHSSFRDHYLDLPFDLSKVLFICTANQLDTIPGPLLDRMDVIQLSGYTEDEKVGIARKYLVPKQLEAHGLTPRQLSISEPMLRLVISEYTREAGVRSLERQLASLARKAATQIAKGKAKRVRVDEQRVRDWLGTRRFSAEAKPADGGPGRGDRPRVHRRRRRRPLHRGDRVPRRGEADDHRPARRRDARVGAGRALVGARAFARARRDPHWFAEHDLHVHVPAGAVPKDGPSAGITIATAIASLLQGRPVSEEVGMTGEITLTGQVLPIGGLREKILAAQRAGLKRVILPRENEPDLAELPAETRSEIEAVPVDRWTRCSPRPSTGPRRTQARAARRTRAPGGLRAR